MADFPYYNGLPVEIAPRGWLAIVAWVAVAFILLITLPFPSFPLNLLQAIVCTTLPLLTLAAVTGGHHTALFGHLGFKQLAQALGFGLLTLVASFGVGLVLTQFVSMTPNPSAAVLSGISPFDTVVFLARTSSS